MPLTQAEIDRTYRERQAGNLSRPTCSNPECGKTMRGSADLAMFRGGLCTSCWHKTPKGLEEKRRRTRVRTQATRARQKTQQAQAEQ
jgi:hypothetical protein